MIYVLQLLSGEGTLDVPPEVFEADEDVVEGEDDADAARLSCRAISPLDNNPPN